MPPSWHLSRDYLITTSYLSDKLSRFYINEDSLKNTWRRSTNHVHSVIKENCFKSYLTIGVSIRKNKSTALHITIRVKYDKKVVAR